VYDRPLDFYDGYADATRNGKGLCVNRLGEIVFKHDFYFFHRADKGRFLVTKSCKAWLIDDLGKESFKTKFSVEKILLPIITYRNEKGLPTCITSKYSPTDLISVYGYGKETKSFIQEVSKTIKNNYSCILLDGLNFSILK
jgi:hypothetical protein